MMQPQNDSTRRILAEGRFVRMVEDDGWEWAERVKVAGVVAVAAVTPDRKLVLTEQYRRPVGARVVDLPAGLAGDVAGAEDEPLLEAARRELMEETGYESDRWELVTEGPTSPGMTTEILTFFLARQARQAGPGGGDGSEDIEVHSVDLDGLHPWLEGKRRAGVLIDPKVYAGAYFALR